MKDAVRIFEEYALSQGYKYYYGSEAHINLLKGDLDKDQIYLLLFPVNRNTRKNSFNTKVIGYNFRGRFMLLKGSDYAKHYFNEHDEDKTTSKYTNNIEPLLQFHTDMENSLLCNGDITSNEWSCRDAVNVLDANKDGLWCSFNLDTDER